MAGRYHHYDDFRCHSSKRQPKLYVRVNGRAAAEERARPRGAEFARMCKIPDGALRVLTQLSRSARAGKAAELIRGR